MNKKCPCFDLIPARRQKQIGGCSAALINEILDCLGIHLLLSIFSFPIPVLCEVKFFMVRFRKLPVQYLKEFKFLRYKLWKEIKWTYSLGGK